MEFIMEDNVIFVGKKNFISYIKGVETVFEINNKLKEVIIKARGKLINKAVDLATSIDKQNFCKDLKLKITKIEIGSSEHKVEGRDKPLMVSIIEITLIK